MRIERFNISNESIPEKAPRGEPFIMPTADEMPREASPKDRTGSPVAQNPLGVEGEAAYRLIAYVIKTGEFHG